MQRDALSYYKSVLPLVAASFDGVPVLWATYPNPNDPPVFHFSYHTEPSRSTTTEESRKLPTVDVPAADGTIRTYFTLRRDTLAWLATEHHALEFHSWTPIASNPSALRYARILLETGSIDRGPNPKSTRDAAIVLRVLLRERGLRAIPLLDGNGGVALYIPFDDAPDYADVRRWLHVLANDAAARHPDLFTTEPNSAGGSRVHVQVRNNAPGLFSVLPYSLRGPDGRCAVAPVSWDELADFTPDHLQIEATKLLDRISERGDLFASQRDTIRPQVFGGLAKRLVDGTPPGDEIKALVARLRATVSGGDPAAWEAAVCDAFAHLGFRSTHLGGHKAPDGYADACAGPLGYRVMLECKTGPDVVPRPEVAEAAKWREDYHAQFNALVGPGFAEETELHDELLTRHVSAWTVDDLVTALDQRLDPLELRACFAPGYAGDAMLDVLAERDAIR